MRCPAQLVHTACLHAGVAAHCSLHVVALTAAPYVTVPAVMRCPAGVGCTSPYRRDACLAHTPAIVGATVGALVVGDGVGRLVGARVGPCVRACVGAAVGAVVGT